MNCKSIGSRSKSLQIPGTHNARIQRESGFAHANPFSHSATHIRESCKSRIWLIPKSCESWIRIDSQILNYANPDSNPFEPGFARVRGFASPQIPTSLACFNHLHPDANPKILFSSSCAKTILQLKIKSTDEKPGENQLCECYRISRVFLRGSYIRILNSYLGNLVIYIFIPPHFLKTLGWSQKLHCRSAPHF